LITLTCITDSVSNASVVPSGRVTEQGCVETALGFLQG
jgi:hypothetical protein